MKRVHSSLNFIRRAFLNVARSKAKSFILIITFFVIGNFVVIGLGVSNAAENAKVLTRKKMRAVVALDTDYELIEQYLADKSDEEINEFWNSNEYSPKYQDLEAVMRDERVTAIQASSYSRSVYIDNENIRYVPLNNNYESEKNENENFYNPGDLFVKTNVFPNCIELIEGTFSLVEGSFYSQEDIEYASDVVVISKDLADYNGLKVGDYLKIILEDPNYLEEIITTIPELQRSHYEADLKIIGIYSHTNKLTPDQENFQNAYPYENPDNLIMIPATTLQKHSDEYNEIINQYYSYDFAPARNAQEDAVRLVNKISLSSVKIFIDDPLNVESFVEDYDGKISQFCVLNANNDEFKKLSKPLDTLSLYANIIIGLVVSNAIIIITLVVALTLKTREYEIGVLLSMGASKVKVVSQFFCELAFVAIFGFTLALGTGSLISQNVGNIVLEYQIQSDEVEDNEYYYYNSVWNDDYFTHITLDDLVEEYDSSISPMIICEIYVIGLGIVFISTLIPALMIMRFNPKKILMNQN